MQLSLAILLTLGLLQPSCGLPLHVDPPEPVVALAMGASRQFTCSLPCTEGTARVQWRGLDTVLGAVQSVPGSSVLSVSSAKLSDAGTRVCVGTCGNQNFQHRVEILVYAFPNELVMLPASLVPGQDREVSCTAHNISQTGPDTLSFALLLGDQELEGVRALEPEQEEEIQDAEEDPLFRVTQRWLLPILETPAPPTLHCQVTMQLPGLELTHRKAVPVLQSQTSLKPQSPTSSDPPKAVSTETLDIPTLLTTPQQDSTLSAQALSSTGACRPEIHQERKTTWELLCEARCGPGVAVHWTVAPGGLEAYKKREAGAQAWLSVPPSSAIPKGWFQCRLDPGGQMTSLYVPGQVFPKSSSDPEVVGPPVALWIGSLVLGLLVLGFLVYSLWKRCRTST